MSESASHAAPGGSMLGGWPALLVTLFVSVAAVISFSHRPLPPFPVSQIYPDKLLITGLAQSADRLLAVGEQGRILYSDVPGTNWHIAGVDNQRGSTLTNVVFIQPDVALAVGHDGWILRSADSGKTWKEVHFSTERQDPLLGVAGPFDGKLFAFGAFGLYLTSSDAGRTWQDSSLVEAVAAPIVADPAATDPAAPVDPAAAAPAPAPALDVFGMPIEGAGGGASGGFSDRHLNGMTRAGDGSLFVVGERGLIAQSKDDGATWSALPEIYQGSFYGVLALPSNGLFVYGMRGNAFYSTDLGQNWQKSQVPEMTSLFDAALKEDGSIVLVGDGNSVYVSTDGGASFTMKSHPDRKGLATVLPMGNGWLTGGENGLQFQQPVGQ